jgi:hypothetical protein
MPKFILALISVTAFAQIQKEPSSTVTILVVDYLGNVIPARLERFTLRGTAVEMASHFDGLKGTEIPFGEYEFVLRWTEHPGSPSKIWSRVNVEAREQTALAVAERDPSGPAVDYADGYSFRFRLEPMPDPGASIEPLRVRFSGLVTNAQEDAVVDASGEFRLHSWLIKGPFLLTVLRGNQILGIQPIVFHDVFPSVVVVKMPHEAPDVIHFRPRR